MGIALGLAALYRLGTLSVASSHPKVQRRSPRYSSSRDISSRCLFYFG